MPLKNVTCLLGLSTSSLNPQEFTQFSLTYPWMIKMHLKLQHVHHHQQFPFFSWWAINHPLLPLCSLSVFAPQNSTIVFHDLLYWRYCEALYNEDCDNKTRGRIINLVTLHLSFQSSVLKNKKKCIWFYSDLCSLDLVRLILQTCELVIFTTIHVHSTHVVPLPPT